MKIFHFTSLKKGFSFTSTCLSLLLLFSFINFSSVSQSVLLDEDFESCGSAKIPTCGWARKGITCLQYCNDWYTGGGDCAIDGTSLQVRGTTPASINCLLEELVSTNIAYFETQLDATSLINVRISFDWLCDGENTFDYGKVMINFGDPTVTDDWDDVPGAIEYLGSTSSQNTTVDLSTVADGNQFYIGFYWVNDETLTSSPGFVVDNVIVEGDPPGPSCRTGEIPADGSTCMSPSSTFSWDIDAGATSYDVYFGTNATPPFATNTTTANYDPGILAPNTTYYWQVVPKDASSSATGCPVWSFSTTSPIASFPFFEGFETVTTPALPPCWSEESIVGGDTWQTVGSNTNACPSGGTAVRITNNLHDDWLFTPPFQLKAGAKYAVSFNLNSNNNQSAIVSIDYGSAPNSASMSGFPFSFTNFTAVSCTRISDTLEAPFDGSYHFGFRSLKQFGTGTQIHLDSVLIEEFIPPPPNCATTPIPADGSTCLDLDTNLHWSNGGGIPSGYLVHFGTDNPPTNIYNGINTGLDTTFNPGTLVPSTTYYWQIVPKNSGGNATGCPVWSFTSGGINPEITIVSDGTEVCEGRTVNFSIDSQNDQGSNPTYQWKVNGIDVLNETGVTYSTSTLIDGDVVSVNLTSDETCANPATVLSNEIIMTVENGVRPTVEIIANPEKSCPGALMTFSISNQTFEGATPSYEWFVNNVSAGETSDTYTTDILDNGDQVYLKMTTSETCAFSPDTVSNTIDVIFEVGAPELEITTASTDICEGDNVTFTISSKIRQGNNPQYQWRVNGQNLPGENGQVFITADLEDGDAVSLYVQSDHPCATPNFFTSNQIMVSEFDPMEAVIEITTLDNGACPGKNLDFSIGRMETEGNNPLFQWYLNGSAINGENNNTFSSSSLNADDVIYVEMISDYPCARPSAIVTSNRITIQDGVKDATANITVTDNEICPGDMVTINATTTLEGNNPQYEWLLNGVVVKNTDLFMDTDTLKDSDTVTFHLISDHICATTPNAFSNDIVFKVGNLQPRVSIRAEKNPICSDENALLYVSKTRHAGVNPTWRWFRNGNIMTQETNDTLILTDPANGDALSIEMTSSIACTMPDKDTSLAVELTVYEYDTMSITIEANKYDICVNDQIEFTITDSKGGGNNPTYQWFMHGQPVEGETGATFTTDRLLPGLPRVSVVTESSFQCAYPGIEYSNIEQIRVRKYEDPEVEISSSTNIACQNDPITINMASSNWTGDEPQYEWYRNGFKIPGETGISLTATYLSFGDLITLKMNSDYMCVNNVTVESGALEMFVSPKNVPIISLFNYPSRVCEGEEMNFELSGPIPAVTEPVFSWHTGDSFKARSSTPHIVFDNLTDEEEISLKIEYYDACLRERRVISTPKYITDIGNRETPEVELMQEDAIFCSNNDNMTVRALPFNPGDTPNYTWVVNGDTLFGENNETIAGIFDDGDKVEVSLESSEECVLYPEIPTDKLFLDVTESPTVSYKYILNDATVHFYPSTTGSLIQEILWDFGDGTTGNEGATSHKYDFNGAYEACITVTDINGCQSSHCDVILVNGLASHNNFENLKIYPNPANDQLFLTSDKKEMLMQNIVLKDIAGKQVLSFQGIKIPAGEHFSISLEGISPGVYHLELGEGNITRVIKR